MMRSRALTKQLRITLVCPGDERRSALVTLTKSLYGPSLRWRAISRVEHDGELVEHITHGHVHERDALLESAEWMRTRFRASATCLGSTVTLVGIDRQNTAAA